MDFFCKFSWSGAGKLFQVDQGNLETRNYGKPVTVVGISSITILSCLLSIMFWTALVSFRKRES